LWKAAKIVFRVETLNVPKCLYKKVKRYHTNDLSYCLKLAKEEQIKTERSRREETNKNLRNL
jgi:hypothetical protein